jgi:hypothetical protein
VKIFLLILPILVSFVYPMESTPGLTLEDEKVSTKSFDKPLAQLLVDVYTMPKWDKEKVDELKERFIHLSKGIALLSNYEVQINTDAEIKLHSYSKTIGLMKDFVSSGIKAIYVDTPSFQYINSIYVDLKTGGLVDEKQAVNICEALSRDISIKQTEEEIDDQHKIVIQELLDNTLGINTVNIEKNKLSGANAGFVVTAKD